MPDFSSHGQRIKHPAPAAAFGVGSASYPGWALKRKIASGVFGLPAIG